MLKARRPGELKKYNILIIFQQLAVVLISNYISPDQKLTISFNVAQEYNNNDVFTLMMVYSH